MAQNESDREDLMGEATSLIRRIEIHSTANPSGIVAGFNALDWLFIYLGAEPMYRFDGLGRLRRAFLNGRLYRSEGNTLAELERQRHPVPGFPEAAPKTTLVRRDLAPDQLSVFRNRMMADLQAVKLAIVHGELTRRIPADDLAISEDVGNRIEQILSADLVLAPRIVRR